MASVIVVGESTGGWYRVVHSTLPGAENKINPEQWRVPLMKRIGLAVALASLLTAALAVPAQAAIHEKVASWCSGQFHTLDPRGQTKFGTQSFLRALQASGMYTIRFGEEPDGTPNPDAVTVDIDYSRPNSKFADAGSYFSFTDMGLTIFVRAGVPDHPAFEHCPNFPL